MRARWKILGALIVLAVVGLILISGRPNQALRDLEATRRKLKREGFKIEVREFNLSLSPELSARAALLGRTTRAAITNRVTTRTTGLDAFARNMPPLMAPAGSNAAVVSWKLDKIQGSPDLWPELRDSLARN